MKSLPMTAISKITAMGRTTVPRKVRLALKSEPGVMLAWDMEPDGRVAVRRIQPTEIDERADGKL